MAQSQIRYQSQKFVLSDNTYLPCNGKYHCMADILFDWLGFSCFASVELDIDFGTSLVESKPVQPAGEGQLGNFSLV